MTPPEATPGAAGVDPREVVARALVEFRCKHNGEPPISEEEWRSNRNQIERHWFSFPAADFLLTALAKAGFALTPEPPR